MTNTIKPGQIIKLRHRLWRVDDFDGIAVTATPIDAELDLKQTFLVELEDILHASIDSINSDHKGDFAAQQLLLRAYRFDLLHGSAPFLSLQRSSVVPYNYQLVPLMMSLEKPTARILIADDVGLGKTIEAGLIISELIQRGRIKRVLILTPANLTEQWKESLDYFFHIDSRIISSFTKKEFEKELPSGSNPWQYFNCCIASIDYAKNTEIKHSILEQKWDLVLVDEVHSCAMPHSNQTAVKQMKRYELLKTVGEKYPNILFLTATPHNGYSDSFASILEILNPLIISRRNSSIEFNKKIARFNVCQRNRKSLESWYKKLGKQSPFPQRNQKDEIVVPGNKLKEILVEIERFGDNLIERNTANHRSENVATWVALHLQKRAISSPFALLQSLNNRLKNQKPITEIEKYDDDLSLFVNDLEMDERVSEEIANHQLDESLVNETEKRELEQLIHLCEKIKPADDSKLQQLKETIIPDLFSQDSKIILFTKYKDTLSYLTNSLNSGDYDLFEMHGDLSSTKRREVFLAFERSKKAILIATDVISEGLNLQHLASNLVHYELPWNPNRLEQRNGRVDRIGQKKDVVQIRTMIMKDSMDSYIIELLISKAETIRKNRDYSGSYFGDEENLKKLILEQSNIKRRKRKTNKSNVNQLDIFSQAKAEAGVTKKAIHKSFVDPFEEETLKRIEKESFYDSMDISLPEIDKRIAETQRIVGSKKEVENFVLSALNRLQCGVQKGSDGFLKFNFTDLRMILPRYGTTVEKITFDPERGLTHPDATVLEIGHPIVKRLIEIIKSDFFAKEGSYGRTAYYYAKHPKLESIVVIYNVLARFTVGITEKRVIEELITFGIDLFDEKEVPDEFIQLEPASTTLRPVDAEMSEWISKALKKRLYEKPLRNKLDDRRNKLIQERQELYNKVVRETKTDEDANWIKEILFIEEASIDLLTLTVVLPLN